MSIARQDCSGHEHDDEPVLSRKQPGPSSMAYWLHLELAPALPSWSQHCKRYVTALPVVPAAPGISEAAGCCSERCCVQLGGSLVPLHTGKAGAAGGVDPGGVGTLQVGATSETTALRVVNNSACQALRLLLNALAAPAPLLGPGAVVAGGTACIGPLSVHTFRVVGTLVPARACTTCRASANAAGKVDKLLHLQQWTWTWHPQRHHRCARQDAQTLPTDPPTKFECAAQSAYAEMCTLLLADTLYHMPDRPMPTSTAAALQQGPHCQSAAAGSGGQVGKAHWNRGCLRGWDARCCRAGKGAATGTAACGGSGEGKLRCRGCRAAARSCCGGRRKRLSAAA